MRDILVLLQIHFTSHGMKADEQTKFYYQMIDQAHSNLMILRYLCVKKVPEILL